MDKIYSKIILFGEYSMILDSTALMMPLRKFYAQWTWGDTNDEKVINSQNSIKKLVDYIKKDAKLSQMIDNESIINDLQQGLYLFSDIPFGYGLGSSGTVVAALWQRYANTHCSDMMELKRIFGKIESHFHGNSSGIDPLQCYIGQPFIITQNGLNTLDSNFIDKKISICLIDTKTKSPTGPLVRHFHDMMLNKEFSTRFNNEYKPCLNDCINTIQLGGKTFFDRLKQLSRLQSEMFKPMITDNVRHLFTDEFDMNFGVKILGSGGGGFVLAFCDDREMALNLLHDFDIIWI